MSVIDVTVGLDDLDKVFRLADLLNNQEELVKEFKPQVQKLMVRKGFFTGVYQREYERTFNELIVRLIKGQMVSHFADFTAEDILMLSDEGLLRVLSEDFYFEQSNYMDDAKEGMN